MTSHRTFLLTLLLAAAEATHGQTSFNRFTEDLSQLLETDSLTVMVRGMTHDFAGQLCARLQGPVSLEVEHEVRAWQARNDKFIKAAASALSDIADRHVPSGGEQEKQAYLQSILQTATRETNKRVVRQLNGASLDNSVVPPERACSGLAGLLRDGAGDFENTPAVTRALVVYMQRKGLR